MKTFEQHINQPYDINKLFVKFDFMDGRHNYDLNYYQFYNTIDYEWIFFYNKRTHEVGVDIIEYNKLNTNIDFEDFIKLFNFEIKYLTRF
jgi:hypothetical protein